MDVFVIFCMVAIGTFIAFALAKKPKLAMKLWLLVMVVVPCWISVKVVATLGPLDFAFILLIPALLYASDQRVTKADLLITGFVTFASISYFAVGTPQYAYATIFTQWLPAYWVGRFLAQSLGRDWMYRAMAVTATIVGLWAVIEFVFNIHVFENFLGTDASAGWQTIQVRGSYSRSEGAFGHSIAMGGFLVIGLPFIIAGKFKPIRRLLMLGAVTAGVIVTFSRGALIGALIVFVLSIFFLPGVDLSKRTRGFLFTLMALAGVTLIPFLLSLFDSLSYDLDPSAQYRVDLTKYIFQDMNPLGPADGMSLMPDGRYFYRSFGSIDNAFVLTVLQFGWIPTLFLVLPLFGLIFRVMRRKGGPADIAMLGTYWVISTVALITQYGMAVWFCAGMAVAFGLPKKPEPAETPARPQAALLVAGSAR